MIFERPLMLATRFLGRKGAGGFSRHVIGAVIGITISIIPLVVVLEVTNGMISGITQRYLEIGTYHIQVRNPVGVSRKDESGVIDIINSIEGVKTVFPVVTGVGLAYSGNARTGVALKGYRADYWKNDPGIRKYLKIESGAFDLSEENYALVSSEAAKTLKIKIGDTFKLLTAKKLKNGKTLLKPSYFTVKGIFSTGYYELDSISVYINIERGSKLFNSPDARFLGVKIDNPDRDIPKISRLIKAKLPFRWYVFTWYELQKPMYESFASTKKMLLFIMLLIVLVASVNIASALTMLVIEKEMDLAILKSTGIHSDVIVSSYVYSGFLIGLSGTVLGIIIGLMFAVNINELFHGIEYIINSGRYLIHLAAVPFVNKPFSKVVLLSSAYYLDYIPVKVRFIDILFIGVSAVSLSTAAAVIPAVRAGRLKPMEVIRRH
ncbi:MAG: ABC transporter permease [Spirochaetes bacterium]|nr:MAG: ABC transporter permease [Spirochaetota bacterium]